MSGNERDGEARDLEPDEASSPKPETLLGDFSVSSPGVQIVLNGRPISAPRSGTSV